MQRILCVLLMVGVCVGTNCQGNLPAGEGIPNSATVIPLGSSTISPSQAGDFATYNYIQTGIGERNLRAEGTMQAIVASYAHPSLGTGFSVTQSIVADRYDGFAKLDSLVITTVRSYVTDGVTTLLVTTSLNGESQDISEPEGGVSVPLTGGATIAVGQSYSYAYKIGDALSGAEYVNTVAVVGIENVTVPYGTVETFKLVGTASCSGSASEPSYSGVYTEWFHPKLGSVKFETDTTYDRTVTGQGISTESAILELVSSSIPLP